MTTIKNRFEAILEKIQRHSQNSKNVKIIAVSKKQSTEKIIEAYEAGARHFGENYVQEALPKILELSPRYSEIRWHFIGNLQTNKMNKIIPQVQFLHSLDQQSQIEKLEKMRASGLTIPTLFLQINIANEETKGGIKESQIEVFTKAFLQNTQLHIHGLMAFPPYQNDPEKNRPYFVKLAELQNRINGFGFKNIKIEELSMGVSNDFHIALEEGSTMIRVGESLFGPRL